MSAGSSVRGHGLAPAHRHGHPRRHRRGPRGGRASPINRALRPRGRAAARGRVPRRDDRVPLPDDDDDDELRAARQNAARMASRDRPAPSSTCSAARARRARCSSCSKICTGGTRRRSASSTRRCATSSTSPSWRWRWPGPRCTSSSPTCGSKRGVQQHPPRRPAAPRRRRARGLRPGRLPRRRRRLARLVDQAAGNAFYLEELIRAFAAGRGGRLPGDGAGDGRGAARGACPRRPGACSARRASSARSSPPAAPSP